MDILIMVLAWVVLVLLYLNNISLNRQLKYMEKDIERYARVNELLRRSCEQYRAILKEME